MSQAGENSSTGIPSRGAVSIGCQWQPEEIKSSAMGCRRLYREEVGVEPDALGRLANLQMNYTEQEVILGARWGD